MRFEISKDLEYHIMPTDYDNNRYIFKTRLIIQINVGMVYVSTAYVPRGYIEIIGRDVGLENKSSIQYGSYDGDHDVLGRVTMGYIHEIENIEIIPASSKDLIRVNITLKRF